MRERNVVHVVFDDIDLLDATGPAEVFALARRESREADHYSLLLAAASLDPIRTGAGVRLVPDVTFDDLAHTRIDTLIVPGAAELDGAGRVRAVTSPEIVEQVSSLAARSRRVASLCVGAHVLAEAGLLDGKQVATHWTIAEQLSTDFPRITVDQEALFLRDGNMWTCAGIGACLDLTLALIADDLGEDVAIGVARHLVIYQKRQGRQAQISALLQGGSSTRRVADLKHYITNNVSRPLTAAELAEHVQVSERHLARLFANEVRMTPRAFVESIRIDVAQGLLDSTDHTLSRIATETGFGSATSLVRAFQRRFGMTPTEYRLQLVRSPGH